MNRYRNHQEGVVMTWLLQVVLVIGFVGLLLFEAGSVAWNYFGTDSQARQLALDISERAQSIPASRLEQEARRMAKDAGGKLTSFEITEETVQIGFKREATTIVISRIGAIKDWGVAEATGSASTS